MILASCSGLIVSYDRETGNRIWEYDVKDDGTAQTFHGEPTRFDGSLFIAADGAGGHVYRIDAVTGDVLWKWHSTAGVSSDLNVIDSTLVLVTDDNRLTTLDISTGDVRWQTESTEQDRHIAPVKPTPAFNGGLLIFGRPDGRVTGHSLAEPQPLWETWLPSGVTTDLVTYADGVILGTFDGYMYRLEAGGQLAARAEIGAVPTYRWMVEHGLIIGLTGVEGGERELIALDAITLEEAWRLRSPDPKGWTSAQPAWGWDLVLVGNAAPALYAVEPQTGRINWFAATDHPPRTVTVDGDELLIGTFDGTLNVYRRR